MVEAANATKDSELIAEEDYRDAEHAEMTVTADITMNFVINTAYAESECLSTETISALDDEYSNFSLKILF